MEDTEVTTRNRETSAREVEAFKTREAGPYTAYLSGDGKYITTWMGDKLAEVTSVGATYRTNFGNKVTPFRARGIDGRTYHGRHNGGNMHLRMRPTKG